MEEACPHLLDLIPKKREWGAKASGEGSGSRASEVAIENLELRLGLPSGKEDDTSLLSLGLSPNAGPHTTLLSPHEPRTHGASLSLSTPEFSSSEPRLFRFFRYSSAAG